MTDIVSAAVEFQVPCQNRLWAVQEDTMKYTYRHSRTFCDVRNTLSVSSFL